MLKQWAIKRNENTARIKILHHGDFNWFLRDGVMNVISGVVPIKKIELKKFEKPLSKLAEKTKILNLNFLIRFWNPSN